MKRRFIDAPTECRCTASITLRDGSKAQCGRRRTHGQLCTQHAFIARERQMERFRALGFQTIYNPDSRAWSARCARCAAVSINGVATHERGCPNARHECNGCNTLIPTNQKYCEDCQ